MRKLIAITTSAAALSLSGCGYNTFQTTDEQIKASWSEVVNQYQRRADLVPNLVNTVKGEANFEQGTLTKVVEARAKATSIQATPELVNDPQAFQKFQQAQGELSGALSRLLVVTENYPTLRANQGFRDLQAQLEGTENRITVFTWIEGWYTPRRRHSGLGYLSPLNFERRQEALFDVVKDVHLHVEAKPETV